MLSFFNSFTGSSSEVEFPPLPKQGVAVPGWPSPHQLFSGYWECRLMAL